MTTKTKEITTKITTDQLKNMIEDIIDEKLVEYFGDPDKGLHIREEVIQKLKAQKKARKPRISMEQLCKERGITLQECLYAQNIT